MRTEEEGESGGRDRREREKREGRWTGEKEERTRKEIGEGRGEEERHAEHTIIGNLRGCVYEDF